jgi:hypothetical protein
MTEAVSVLKKMSASKPKRPKHCLSQVRSREARGRRRRTCSSRTRMRLPPLLLMERVRRVTNPRNL